MKIKGYTNLNFDLLDLDADFSLVESSSRKILSCQVPKNFKEIKDE